MITDVYIVYNDDNVLERLGGSVIKEPPFFHFIDDRTYRGKKDSFKLKGSWGARKTPFAVCMKGDKVVKVFYSEAETDVINSLIKYLNE